MRDHKFTTGQKVTLGLDPYDPKRPTDFEVVRQLPRERGINHYRLRSLGDGHERVVTEAELS